MLWNTLLDRNKSFLPGTQAPFVASKMRSKFGHHLGSLWSTRAKGLMLICITKGMLLLPEEKKCVPMKSGLTETSRESLMWMARQRSETAVKHDLAPGESRDWNWPLGSGMTSQGVRPETAVDVKQKQHNYKAHTHWSSWEMCFLYTTEWASHKQAWRYQDQTQLTILSSVSEWKPTNPFTWPDRCQSSVQPSLLSIRSATKTSTAGSVVISLEWRGARAQLSLLTSPSLLYLLRTWRLNWPQLSNAAAIW